MAKPKTPRNNSKTTDTGSPTLPNLSASAEGVSELIAELKEVRRSAPDSRKNLVPINLDDEIRRRAYELWQERGYESGHQEEHWLLAEREVRQRYTQQRQHFA